MKYLSDVIKTFDKTRLSTKICVSLSAIVVIMLILKK